MKKKVQQQNRNHFSSLRSPFIVLHMKWTYLTDYQILSAPSSRFGSVLLSCRIWLLSIFILSLALCVTKGRQAVVAVAIAVAAAIRIQWHRELLWVCMCLLHNIKLCDKNNSLGLFRFTKMLKRYYIYFIKVYLGRKQEAFMQYSWMKKKMINFYKIMAIHNNHSVHSIL